MIYISFVLAVLPAILLVLYFQKKDSLKPEPPHMLWGAFGLGAISVIPAVIIGLIFESLEYSENIWISLFMQSFVTAALFEEVSKFAVFRIVIYKNKHFDEVTDGIIYMAIVSLGFACFENVMYSVDDIFTGLLRAFTAVPGHAIWSGIMGYYIGRARFSKQSEFGLIFAGLFLGILYHGAYDFVLFTGTNEALSEDYSLIALLIIPILILGVIHLHILLKKSKAIDKVMLGL